jgi:hypothetical protein
MKIPTKKELGETFKKNKNHLNKLQNLSEPFAFGNRHYRPSTQEDPDECAGKNRQ